MVSKLYLLRHARAGWARPGMRDFDRPLDSVGLADAQAMGAAMRAQALLAELTLCSTARRCQETLQALGSGIGTGEVLFLDELYSEDAVRYLALIHAHGRASSLLVIGHNPMMEVLAMALSGDGEPEAQESLAHGFPTAALAVIRFDAGLHEAVPGSGYLEAFLTPAQL